MAQSRLSALSDEQSKLNARLEAHMVYICPECGKAFRTQAEWRQHLNFRHDYLKKTYTDFNFIQIDNRFHECQLCFKWVENAHKTIALLQYHYFMHLDHRDTYRCVHCRMAYTRRRALNKHLMDTHMREIEQYESKLRHGKKQPDSKPTPVPPVKQQTKVLPVARNAAPKKEKRNDLLEKALQDIDLQAELRNSPKIAKPKLKPNASELALDRCLNAYEDIVRKEENNGTMLQYDAELDELCQEFFDETTGVGEEIEKKYDIRTQSSADDQKAKEVVIIEIDALGEDEVDQLKKEMKPIHSPPSKRRRISKTPDQDSESELPTDDLMKLISFLCPKCGKEIASMDDWRLHVFKKHDFEHFIENSFKILEKGRKSMCLQCNEVQPTTKLADLQKHCFKHLPYRSYLKCSLCDRTKTSMSKMFNHIRYNHQDELLRKNKTKLLIKPEPKSNSPTRAAVNVEKQPPYKCPNCPKIFKMTWRYDRHRESCQKPETAKEYSMSTLLSHLREGQERIRAIWTQIKMEL